ncbi:MAG: mycofactocin-coupled SDR family oxidoreductase [Beutenbergiaceae bacterium]
MGQLDGQVAFITGAARGQGRAHAVRLAEEGADIIAVDLCDQIPSVGYPMATKADLDETVSAVEALDRRIHAQVADVRDREAMQSVFDAGVAELGDVRIVAANAGIIPMSRNPEPGDWFDVIGVNLTGVYHTIEVAKPSMVAHGKGGSIVITSSTAGIAGIGGKDPGGLGYTAAKHGVVGLMRSYANQLGEHSIRVNTIHPTGVNTPMVVNDLMSELLAEDPQMGQAMQNVLPVPMIEAVDLSNAVLFLSSEAGRYITGVTLPVDAGFLNRR